MNVSSLGMAQEHCKEMEPQPTTTGNQIWPKNKNEIKQVHSLEAPDEPVQPTPCFSPVRQYREPQYAALDF